MRNLILGALGIAILILASCVEEKDLSNSGNGGGQENEQTGLTADFSLRSEQTIVSVAVAQAEGLESVEGVKLGIYTSLPVSGADGKLEEPAVVGFTDKHGKFEATVAVPNNASKIYIIPLTPGYASGEGKDFQGYDIQKNISVNLHPVAFPTANPRTRAGEVDDEYTAVKNVSTNFPNLNILYANSEVSADGIPIPESSNLVSKETLSPNFINMVNSWYPEKQNVKDADFSKNSDLEVVHNNGAEVWVTYIGDGGFYAMNRTVYNSLLYYNYKDDDLKKMSALKSDETINPSNLHMTMLLPNTNQMQCPIGLKVQLLYWDEERQAYSKIFPKGTRIGFAVAREGYRKNGAAVTSSSAYGFNYMRGNSYYPQKNGDVKGNYYSTPQLNQEGKSQAVTRWVEGYECCVTGIDIRPIGDIKSDYDFNDVLFKISSSPVPDAIQPGEIIDPVEVVVASESIYGTLAFEDKWPEEGDYDMNDFVVNYTYTLGKNEKNLITEIKLQFDPIAKGAASYTKMGFGIELPVAVSNVNTEKLSGATLEAGNENVTFIIWNDVKEEILAFNGAMVNTEKGSPFVSASDSKITITIPLLSPVTNLSVVKFNPFIFVGGRSHEIHLPDFKPTIEMDMKLLSTGIDCSDVSKGVYFRMKNMYAWALDFPRESASSATWKYPIEKTSIAEAYPGYSKWVVNKTDISWFEAKNAVGSLLYEGADY